MGKEYFLNEIVFGWIKNDLENISRVRVVIPGSGNANFPLAMCTIIYMDHLGGYLLGTETGGLEANITEYLNCFENPEDYPPELLTDLFRNGLAHDYFARGAIGRNSMRPPMVNAPGVGVVLDADSLLSDFIRSLGEIRNRLTEENYQSRLAEAKRTMEARYKTHQEIIQRLPAPPAPIAVSPSMRASGATGGTQIYSGNGIREGNT